ncbi:MAG: ATP-binding protein [Bacteroidetes bacterium]|nr:ATP-binding protein [Bacteroidota bacterium]
MIFKRFSVAVFARTVVLCLTVFLLIYLLTKTTFIATPFIVALLIIAQIYSLIHYVQKTNRDIARFFDSIKYSDFSQSFRSNIKGSSFEDLNNAFSEVIEQFKKTRAEKEEHYRYLQTVVQHVGIGLLAFTSDGTVELMNTAAKKLFKINGLKNAAELSVISKPLVETLNKIKAGEKVLVKISDGNELSQLSIYATEFKLRESHYTLVSITNIQSELEEREMEAWQNLIRVLTHEIMNSMTPIISLSSTANSLLGGSMDEERDRIDMEKGTTEKGERKTETSHEKSEESFGTSRSSVFPVPFSILQDVKGALDTISKRSEGLLHFVDDYRNLTRIPVPNFQLVKVFSLFQRIEKLFSEQFLEREIDFSYSVEPSDLEVTADPDLIEQVLINLIVNSLTALSNSPAPRIRLTGKIDNRGGILVQVTDNGTGIPPEIQDKIFIPFFTTKENGSGIGLSLSRQILSLHRATIGVHSEPNVETVFTVRF